MELKDSEILKLSKEAITEYVTSSRKITAKPCWVFLVLLNPEDAALVSQAYIRNGETSSSEIILAPASQFGYNNPIGPIPVYFNKGIYVDLDTNITGMTIQYLLDF